MGSIICLAQGSAQRSANVLAHLCPPPPAIILNIAMHAVMSLQQISWHNLAIKLKAEEETLQRRDVRIKLSYCVCELQVMSLIFSSLGMYFRPLIPPVIYQDDYFYDPFRLIHRELHTHGGTQQ